MPMTDVIDADAAPARTVDHAAHPARAAALDGLAALLCILPLLLTAHLPLTDLPNHLARQYILRDWASSPTLQAFYAIHWALVPNLALEIFVLAVRRVMSIDLAIRTFCIVTMLLLFGGTRLVNRQLGGAQARAYRFAPLLCYGGPFQYGFLSYCFGIGLALLLFGFYLRIRERGWGWLVLLMPLSFALLLCHLAAFGLFAIAVGACELTHGFVAAGGLTRRLPAALVRHQVGPLLCLVPVFLVFLWLSPTADHSTAASIIRFSTLHQKARSFASITLFTSPKLEVGLLALALAGLAAAVLSRTMRLHPVGAAATATMLLVWLALPNIALGGAYIDYRVPWAVAFFLLASVIPGRRHDRLAVPFAGCFAALAVARIALIAGLWLSWEPTLAALDTALSRLPVGSRLMVVEGRPPSGEVFRQPDLEHVAAYAVARRQAFMPGMFASLSGQILYFQPHYLDLAQQAAFEVAIPASLERVLPDYDYILDLLPDLARIGPDVPVVCEASGPHFMLLKVGGEGAAALGDNVPCPG
ncbi:MAG: hypothetical protein P4L71_22505 [Acetobacteraceae bacterium]|nr:hypothetical protein [Acetobacteraceae bacterium]